MGKAHKPRSGSMQFWPRKRAKRLVARVRAWPKASESKPLGFAGYKAGMTHAILVDNGPHSKTKGKDIFSPITIIECPPLKILSIRFYKINKNPEKHLLATEVISEKPDKSLAKKLTMPKKAKKLESIKPEDYDYIRLLVYTQPRLTGIGKKKPEILELGLGGKKEEQLAFAKSKLNTELAVGEVFSEGQQVDMHGITKGKGFQGPMKRFGISRTQSKSEKAKRNPGSLGGWKAQGKVMYRVPHAGQTGMHQRVHLNGFLLKIGSKPEEINIAGGLLNYGLIKNTYLLFKGSIPGARKRLITFTLSAWPNRHYPKDAPAIAYLSTLSKQ